MQRLPRLGVATTRGDREWAPLAAETLASVTGGGVISYEFRTLLLPSRA